MLRRGPEAVDGVQVGFLPFDEVTEPAEDLMAGGPNPLGEHYDLVPQLTYKIHYFPINFNNPTVAGKIFKQLYFRQALQSCLDSRGAIRDVYKATAIRPPGPSRPCPTARCSPPPRTRTRTPSTSRRPAPT